MAPLATAAALTALVTFSAAAQTRVVQFDIAAQSLDSALMQFAIQADASVSHSGLDLGSLKAPPVRGHLTLEAALTALLAKTGLDFDMLDARTIRIVRRASPAVRQPAPQAAPAIEEIEDILVTAMKRPGGLQSQSYSMAAMTGAELDGLSSNSANDLVGRIAGVTATNLGAGRDKFFLRGLSDGSFTGHTQSTVGLYLDDARLTFDAPDPSLQLVDIERVEVVRGPQGTLYGAGSIGGLVVIVSNKPDPSRMSAALSTEAALTQNGEGSVNGQAMLNLPLSEDRLALRLVGYGRRDGGFIDDARLGKRDVNRSEIAGFRGGLSWILNDRWNFTTGMVFQSIASADTQYYQESLGRFNRANFLAEPHDNDFFELYFTARAALSWADMVSTTAYIRHGTETRYDASLSTPLILGAFYPGMAFDQDFTYQTVTHETRLTSVRADRLHWLLGLFLSHHEEHDRSTLDVPRPDGTADRAFLEIRDDNGYESAIFGQLGYELTDRISVTGGLRVFFSATNARSLRDGVVNHGPSDLAGRHQRTGVTPQVTVSYKLDKDNLFYLQGSQGFRLGGVNFDSPVTSVGGNGAEPRVSNFESDTLTSFEAGAKSSFLDQRLVVNGALFLSLWKNVQSDQIRADGFPFTANIGDVTNFGVEADIRYKPVTGFEIMANLALHQSDLVRPNPAIVTTPDNRAPGAPGLSAGVSGRYEWAPGPDIDAFIAADAQYIGISHLTFDSRNSPKMGDYAVVNLSVGATRGPWKMTLFVDNLLNEKANTFAFGNPFSIRYMEQVTPLRPRTLGIRFGWTY